MSARLLCPLLAVSVLLGCETPPVFPTSEPRQNSLSSRIEGKVVVTSRSRGNAVVLLYEAARPPPPLGTGRPISFTIVPASELFGASLYDTSSGGPFVAPYAFSLVAPGSYIIRAFLDRDECAAGLPNCIGPDFLPWYTVTAEPNRGDVGGGAVDAVSRAARVINIAASNGTLPPALDVQVSIADGALIPADRPAFAVSMGDAIFPSTLPTKVLELAPEPIDMGVVHQRQPVFLAKYVDDNLDGIPDDANGDGEPDFWPKITVRKLKDVRPYLTDENDEDEDGVLDRTGADYPHQDGTTDGRPDLVVLAAKIDYESVKAALTDGMGKPRMDAVPVATLRVLIGLRALDASNPLAPAPLAGVPQGRYAIILRQFTGQTWRIPNELQPDVAPTQNLPLVQSQAFTLLVQQ